MKKQHEMFLVGMTAAVLLPALASADVCGSGLSLPANIWTMISAPCIPPTNAPTVNDQFNSDLGAGAAYGTTWVMYKLNLNPNAARTAAYEQLTADSLLEQGVGYWIYSTQAGTLKIDNGRHTTDSEINPGDNGYYGDCGQFGWSGQPCYKIDLAVPASGARQWNLVGYPFPRSADWAEVHVAAYDGNTWTDAGMPNAADQAGYISKTAHVYKDDGSGYTPFDDVTSQEAERMLKPNKSYWVQSRNDSGASVSALALLIPAPPYKMFITFQKFSSNLRGLQGADEKCMMAARAPGAGLSGTYKAWLSDSYVSAADRLTHAGPIVKTGNGEIIATSWPDLIDGQMDAGLSHDEFGRELLAINETVWTGTLYDGTVQTFYYFLTCNDWRSTEDWEMTIVGYSWLTSKIWTGVYEEVHEPFQPCQGIRHLWCIEQQD